MTLLKDRTCQVCGTAYNDSEKDYLSTPCSLYILHVCDECDLRLYWPDVRSVHISYLTDSSVFTRYMRLGKEHVGHEMSNMRVVLRNEI